MNQTRTCGVAAIVLALGAGGVARKAAAQAGPEDARAAAREVIERALEALGPQSAADALPGLLLQGSGTRTQVGQGGSPEHPASTLPFEIEWVLDFANRRARRTTLTRQGDLPYFGITSRFARPRSFHTEDVTTVLFPVDSAAGERTRSSALRRYPEPRGRLLDALAETATLGAVEGRPVNGEPLDVVEVRLENAGAWRLYVDARSRLVRRVERGRPVRMPLDTLPYSIEYGEYRTVGGLRMPSWVRESRPNGTSIGSVTIDEYRFERMRVLPQVHDSVFAVPPKAFPRQADGRPTLREVAPGVVFIENARPNYNQLAVAFDEYLLVVDAPFHETVSDTVLARLARRFPGKPIRYFVPTHFHYDHIGGLGAYVRAGAEILTTPGNEAFLRDVIRRTDAFRNRPPAAVELATVRDSLVIGDGHQSVVLYAIEPTEHVDHMLLVSVPAARLLYVADLVSADWGRLRPAIPETFQFREAFRRLGLAVDVILPGHGPPVTRAALDWAIEEGRRMQVESR